MKTCSTCQETKSITQFYRSKKGCSRGRDGRCKACVDARHREYERQNPGRAAQRKREFKMRTKYGLTLDEADALVGRGCAICGTTDARICIDHDHESGTVRGALCFSCNIAIGYMKDDPARLRSAADYLHRWQQSQES